MNEIAVEEIDAELARTRSSMIDVRAGLVDIPKTAGLYAVYGEAKTWDALNLSGHERNRPLYLGKSVNSLANRDVEQHFYQRSIEQVDRSGTGWSTLRRSLAAMLSAQLDLHGVPRNLSAPGYFASFGLEMDGDHRLTDWMLAELSLAVWESPASWASADIKMAESRMMRHLVPPLNLTGVATPWRHGIKSPRKMMAAQARTWRG